MRMRAKSFAVVIALFLGVFGSAPSATATVSLQEGTDKAAVLFDPLKVITIKIDHALGEPVLTHKYLDSPVFRKANIRIYMAGSKKYVALANVGVRLKGSYTRKFEKMSLKVNLDEFVPGQNFLGITRLTLNAMYQDWSLVHEVTGYKLFRSAGIPAPRAGYAKVSVEGRYMGLYLNLESIDSDMLKRWFKSTKHVYSGPRPCDLTPYNQCYQPSLGDTNRADLVQFTKLDNLHGSQWWTEFKKRSNSELVLRMIATEIFLSHWDGYNGYSKNNHFVHFDNKNRMTLIPWGLDQTFPAEPKKQMAWGNSDQSYFRDSTTKSTIHQHCFEYAPCFNELLHQGILISKVARDIDLVGYKNQISEKINRSQFRRNNMSAVDFKTQKRKQAWIDEFLVLRTQALRDFLAARKPAPLGVTTPKKGKNGETITATLQPAWEPGVRVRFQWLLNGEPISGATNPALKLKNFKPGDKLKLEITLSKNGVLDTVYRSKSIKVS